MAEPLGTREARIDTVAIISRPAIAALTMFTSFDPITAPGRDGGGINPTTRLALAPDVTVNFEPEA